MSEKIQNLTYSYSDAFCTGVCDNHSTAKAEIGFSIDGKKVVRVAPTPKGQMAGYQHIILDALNLEAKNIDFDKYSFMIVEYKYESKCPLKDVKMGINILPTKLAVNNSVGVHSYDPICSGEWSRAYFNIGKPLKPALTQGSHILSQLHLFPFGSAKPSSMSEDDVMYISDITFTDSNPNPDRTFNVSFTSGGGKGNAPETVIAHEDEVVSLPECPFTMNGYKFEGWCNPFYDHMTSGYVTTKEVNSVMQPGDKITVDCFDMTFFARWALAKEPQKCKIAHTPYDKILVGDNNLTLDELSDIRRKEILETGDEIKVSGTKYFVSADGCDENDGLSPENAWKTIDKVNASQFKAGDGVFFKRGDIFRGNLATTSGVTYAAYGNGAKPKLMASEENGAGAEKWTLVEGTENIWKYYKKFCEIGGIVVDRFDGKGEYILEKECANVDFNTITYYKKGIDGEKFEPLKDIRNNWFFCMMDTPDFRKDRYDLILRCDEGNPGELFKSIEFIDGKGHVIRAVSDVTIDNLCILYGACHGIGAGTVRNLVVTNCEIGWIGGGLFGVWRDAAHPGFLRFGRYGNGVEVYGGCDRFIIDNCYVYQCFDAGITNQFQKGSGNNIVEKDVVFTNNLIEYCCYNIEYFMGIGSVEAERFLQNVLYENNILRAAGFGWGRPNPTNAAAIKGWDHFNKSENFVIRNNIFDRSYGTLLHIGTQQTGWMPEMEGNIYIQHDGSMLGTLGATPTIPYVYDDTAHFVVENVLGDSVDKLYFLDKNDRNF